MFKLDTANDTAIKSALVDAMENIIMPAYDEYGIEFNVYPVEHRSLDGFRPHTNGGYRVILSSDLSAIHSSGITFNDKAINAEIQKLIAISIDMSVTDFIAENASDLRAICKLSDEDDLDSDIVFDCLDYDLHTELWEKMCEMEQHYLTENSDFAIELRAHYYAADNLRNTLGSNEVWFCAGINTDLGYYRDKGLEIAAEYLIEDSKLTPWKIARIVNGLAHKV